ncbi:hypothetical protein [Crenobacter cavernae]|uniref:Uncharacterized protein n=1 Tax=Crenobacter cavernae TaxID=2290923 RepID=A0A345Y8R8_9NEIS|nr:hypothetical protein [Crenobacter cavernae]AXK40320.1 hypothetical protein DWG20_13265 [Crenobacter cavernae]
MTEAVKKGDSVTFKAKHREGAGAGAAVRPVAKGFHIDIKINGCGEIRVRPAQVLRAASLLIALRR